MFALAHSLRGSPPCLAGSIALGPGKMQNTMAIFPMFDECYKLNSQYPVMTPWPPKVSKRCTSLGTRSGFPKVV